MWIVSEYGLFNTDKLSRIEGIEGQTFGYDGARRHRISDKPVVADILRALEEGKRFVEVE